MKLHRFYLKDRELPHDFWMDDKQLFHQWANVLRFQPGHEVVLFNDRREERLYKIQKFGNDAAHLSMVTELEPNLPQKDIYLCFALLKKDKNEWILQKGTELGVSHFVPLLAERTEKTGWDEERALKIVTEAAEQCGRTDIPRLREPLSPQKLIEELNSKVALFVAEQGSPVPSSNISDACAVLIGPEGGWSDEEKHLFESRGLTHFPLSDFTLRAETAAIAAAALLQ